MAARSWTQTQKERQREAIQNWKPWEQSSGPKTTEGKDRVSKNGWKGGTRQAMREMTKTLRSQRERLETLP